MRDEPVKRIPIESRISAVDQTLIAKCIKRGVKKKALKEAFGISDWEMLRLQAHFKLEGML